jgi:glycosyltransferase involved in cell wall biosynthesis
MNLVFINPNLQHDYNAGTPFERPLAGSESAQCYLAVELARRGHEVYLLNGAPRNAEVRGVHCRSLTAGFDAMPGPDAIFVTNAPEFCRSLREMLGNEVPIFAWEHNHWNNDPAYSSFLQEPACSRDYVLCVSDWHRAQFISGGRLDPERVFVLRNAIAPFFEDLFTTEEEVLAAKMWPPVLAFTSTPYTGLEAAVLFFLVLRQRWPTVTLNVFSSFDMYAPNNMNRANPRWQELYQRCRQAPGINYVGNVPQRWLARTLRGTLALFYPNVWPETSSICTMEAMAAGCAVITTAQGALPETSAGFAEIIAPREGKSLTAEDFVSRTLALIERFTRSDAELEAHLKRQVDFVTMNCRWPVRARELEALPPFR